MALARVNRIPGDTFRAVHLFYRTQFASAAAVFAPNEQTPTFKVKRVLDSNLDKSSTDQIDPAAKPNPDNAESTAGREEIIRQIARGSSSEHGAAR